MNKLFLTILILTFLSCSKTKDKVFIEGKVKSENFSPVIISTLDTIVLSRDNDRIKKRFDSLSLFNENISIADYNGFFSIYAASTDSIYFKSYDNVSQSFLVADYLKQKEKLINLKACDSEFDCDEKGVLFAFVAETISLEQDFPKPYCEQVRFNSRFKAQYKVIENIYGDIKKDTISFTIFDHFGWPKFKDYPKVLLYVTKYCEVYIHEKYQYNPILETESGEFASPFLMDDYRYSDPNFPIKPKKIVFKNPIIDTYTSNDSIDIIKNRYPEPYFRVTDNKVAALYGNSIDEVFNMKKLTTLKSRGWFD